MNYKRIAFLGGIIALVVVCLIKWFGYVVENDDDIIWELQEFDKEWVFSMDTIQPGDWTHFALVFPYDQHLDSLFISRGIRCKEKLLEEIKTLTMLDATNTLLFVKDDTIRFIKRIPRSVVEFANNDFGDLKMIRRKESLIIDQNKQVKISGV